ncbi:MAG: hypothetical protein HYV09_24030 [Deltaproteobacteria bacterium]|nr:hypothetical protein [Deltaproteobacteria bacterium]
MLPRQKRVRRAALSAVGVTMAAVVVALLVRRPTIVKDLTVVADGQFGIRLWEVARNAFARGDGFPGWDRSVCAGHPFVGNPDAQLLSSLVAGVFGVHGDVMARWYPTIGVALAVAGTFLWTRRALGLAWLPALFAGALFGASGFLGLHTAVRMTFVPFALIPWALWLAHEAERDLRAALGLGAALALMLIEGGLFPFCFALVALTCALIPRVFAAGVGVVSRIVAVAAITCLLLGAIKIFPVMAQLARAPRVVKDLDAGPFTDLIPMLGDADRGAMPGRHYHINEFRGYIGPFAFGMAIAGAGVALILKPRRIGLLLILIGAAVLTRGRFADWAPWTLLTRVPVFDQLQVPSRFVLVVDLAAAAAAAVALDASMRAVKRRALMVPLLIAAVIAVLDPIAAGQKILKANTTDAWLPRPDPKPARYHLVAGDDFGRMATYPGRNVGTPACQKVWPYPEGGGYAIGDVPQASADDGEIARADVRQNGATIEATLRKPGAAHLNQTFDPDFVASIGQVRRSAKGTLDVLLPAGSHRLEVRYRPKGLLSGMIVTSMGVLGAIAALVFLRKRAR